MDLPAGWVKRPDDLKPTDHGDGRLFITAEEIAWANEYERRLLRPWARFPREGEIYEATTDFEVTFLTHWKAPVTDGGDGLLPKGTRIRVSVSDDEPVAVSAQGEHAKKLERVLIPWRVRWSRKYNGYSIPISTEDLNRHFRLVDGSA